MNKSQDPQKSKETTQLVEPPGITMIDLGHWDNPLKATRQPA